MLLPFLAVVLQAAEEMTRFVPQPGSKVSIKGSGNVHDYEIRGKELHGTVNAGAGFLVMDARTLNPGKGPIRIEGFIPVRSLHSGSGAMDRILYHHLKEQANPRILFRFGELSLKTVSDTNGAPYVFDSQVELVVAGVTNQISMPIQVLQTDDNKLKLVGSTSVRMTDFGITPPEFGSGVTVKYEDNVELSVEWLVSREHPPATKDKP